MVSLVLYTSNMVNSTILNYVTSKMIKLNVLKINDSILFQPRCNVESEMVCLWP